MRKRAHSHPDCRFVGTAKWANGPEIMCSPMHTRKSGTILAVVFVAAYTLLFFREPIFYRRVFHVWDLSKAYYPIRVHNAALRSKGVIPLWNRYIWCGYPVNAESEKGPLYLPSLVFNLPIRGGEAYTLYIVLHYVLAAAGVMLLAKRSGISETGQTAAALVFVFGGSFVAQTVNLTLVTTFAWTPLILALQMCALQRESYRAAAVAGLALGISLLGAHPQMSFYTALLILLFSLSFRSRARRRARIAVPCLMLAIGLGLAAPQFLYNLDLNRFTVRRERTPYEFVTSYSLPPHYLAQLLVPDLFGDEECYVGQNNIYEMRVYLGILALGGIVLGWRWRGAAALFFKITLMGAVFLALGRYVWVYHLLRYLPGFGVIRCPARLLLPASLAAGMLAGAGIDGAIRCRPLTRRASWIGSAIYMGVGCLLLALGGVVLLGYAPETCSPHHGSGLLGCPHPADMRLAYAIRSMGWSALLSSGFAFASALWFYAARWPSAAVFLSVSAPLLLAFDLWCANGTFHRFGPPSLYEDVPATVAFLRRDASLFRTYASVASWEPTPYSQSDKHKLADLDGTLGALYETEVVTDPSLHVAAMPNVRLLRFLSPPTLSRLATMNVKYVLAPRGVRMPLLVKRFETRDRCLFEYSRCLERVRLCQRFMLVPHAETIGTRIDDPAFDAETTVILEEAPTFDPSRRAEPLPAHSSAKIIHYASCDVYVSAATTAPSILVLADFYFPGWRCFVNGRAAAILRADSIFRGVGLGAGEHNVRFVYKPKSFSWGLFVCETVVAVLAVWAVSRLGLMRLGDRASP